MIRRLFVSVVALTALSCGDSGGAPSSPGANRTKLAFAPAFSASALQAASIYHAANLDVDRVRVIVVRLPADTLKDTTAATTLAQTASVPALELAVSAGAQLSGALEFRAGSTLLFSGQGTVTVPPANDPPPSAIPVVAVGPGANAATVVVAPASGSFPTTAPANFAARALTSSGADIANAIFAWSIDDATVATINAATGAVQPTSKGGAVHVRATTVNGTFGEAVATFSVTPGPPTSVVAVSGTGQSGPAGTTLGAPLVIQVTDAAGNPTGGIPVAWAVAPANGTLQNAQSTTGPDGRAAATWTLGPTVGIVVVTATAAGKNVNFVATVVPGPAAVLSIAAGGGQTAKAGTALATIAVKVADSHGNGVPNETVAFAVASGGGSVVVANGATDVDGLAHATWTLGSTLGVQTIVATRSGLVGSPLTISATATASVPQTAVALAFLVQPSATTLGVPITPPVTVRAIDANGNTVPSFTGSVTVNLSGSGATYLAGTLTRSAIGGIASFDDVSVNAPGSGLRLNTFGSGLNGDLSVPFTVTTGNIARIWNGSASSDWNVAANWTGGVPAIPDNVTIPGGTPHQPVLTSTVTIADLTVAAGATLSIGSFFVNANGNVDAPGAIVGSGAVVLRGRGSTIRGNLPNVLITEATTTYTTAAGLTAIAGTLTLSGGASLTIASGATLTAGATSVPSALLSISGGSATVASLAVAANLTQTGGTFAVTGDATFSGPGAALLRGGNFIVGGNLAQTGTSFTYLASQTHRTTFTGNAAHTIQFENRFSAFQDLELAGPGAVTLGSPTIAANGQLVAGSGRPTIVSSGSTLTVVGADVAGLVFDNTYVVSTGGTIGHFDNVAFQNYSPTLIPLTIVHPGGATPFTFTNTQFLVVPTTGKYLSVTDSNTGDGLILTINLRGSTPADGSSATLTKSGAIVNWGTSGASSNVRRSPE